jgi:16S rRNA (cytosine1402-N4)-methyltransferase
MRHIPVLLQQVLSGLKLDELQGLQKEKIVFVDCNLGDGGHTEQVIKKLHGKLHAIGFDMDSKEILRASTHVQARVGEEKKKDPFFSNPELQFIQANFTALKVTLADLKVDAILFDLGISSYEIEESGRGFSFRLDEPLQMTFGSIESHTFTAYDIVNSWEEENIADIIFGYGEDTFSRRIAKAIVEHRVRVAKDGTITGQAIKTTSELAEIIKKAYPGFARNGRIHPATKTFQALRIAVNDELRSIESALPQAFEVLKEGGRLAVITFHSLEDRIVKRYFKEKVESGEAKAITKKPIIPDEEEVKVNPRSRSSKLRIIEKNDIEKN